jgi:hypothetical protein
LRTPKWWFKRRNGNGAGAGAGAASAPTAQLALPIPMESAGPPAAISPVSSSSHASPGGIQVHVDPDGQHVTLRLSFTATAVVLFTIGVVIVLAYLLGRQARPDTPLLSSVSTEQLRNSPAQPSVLNVERGGASGADAASAEPDGEPAGDASAFASSPSASSTTSIANSIVSQPTAPTWNDAQPPATVVVDDARRNIGLNYVVVQGYMDEKLASEACALLGKNKLSCTVERGLRGWGDKWYLVVGTRGFSRTSSPQYKDYVTQIQAVSKQFAPKDGWKAFKPMAYKWDRER